MRYLSDDRLARRRDSSTSRSRICEQVVPALGLL